VRNLGEVGCLNFRPDAHKGASQRILGGGEQHLLLDLGRIRRPAEEDEFVPRRTIHFVFKVVNGPSTLVLWEVGEEVVVLGVTVLLLDGDLGEILAEVVDDVLVLMTKFLILDRSIFNGRSMYACALKKRCEAPFFCVFFHTE